MFFECHLINFLFCGCGRYFVGCVCFCFRSDFMLCAKCMFWVLGNRCVLVGDLVVLYDFVVKGW